MKRFLNITAFVLGVAFTLGITVCAFANVSKAGDMVGVVAAKNAASIEVMDLPVVESVRGDYGSGRTRVEFDPAVVTVEQIVAAIADAGYGAEVVA